MYSPKLISTCHLCLVIQREKKKKRKKQTLGLEMFIYKDGVCLCVSVHVREHLCMQKTFGD